MLGPSSERPLRLSVVIPARNEAANLSETVESLVATLHREGIPFEILVVNDHSTDATPTVLAHLQGRLAGVRGIMNEDPGGFGYAVRAGLRSFSGDMVAVMMADGSDSPEDLVRYYRTIEGGVDCAFGSRFLRSSRVTGYPLPKLLINRLANGFIRILFGFSYNDITNAFKAYRRKVIEGAGPLFSRHFNLTVELPLKAIVRGYSWTVVPIGWRGRTRGISKLKIREMGSRYLFVVLTVLMEKWLTGGDYRRPRNERVVQPSGDKG